MNLFELLAEHVNKSETLLKTRSEGSLSYI